MYKIKKSELLAEVMDCMEHGRELIVYNYGENTRVKAFREGMVPSFQGWRDVLYSYKFDISEDEVTIEDADWVLDRFLLQELQNNGVEVVQ